MVDRMKGCTMKYKMLRALVIASLAIGVTTVDAADVVVTKECSNVVATKEGTDVVTIKEDTNVVVTKESTDVVSTKEGRNAVVTKEATPAVTSKDKTKVVVTKDSTTANSGTFSAVNTKPILLRTLYGQVSPTEELAIQDGKHLYVPLAIYKQVNLNPINSEKGQPYVQLPVPRRAGDMLYAGDTRQGQRKIQLATTTLDGQLYVDMNSISPAIGVMATKTKQGIELSAPLGSMPLGERKEIQGPVAWVFDPFVTTAYEGPLAKKSTSIISPTWFDISEKGLTVKPNIQLAYVNQYKDQKYRVWPLVTNTFNPDFTSRILNNEKSWSLIGDDLVLYALTYGYDGYNLDFENIHYKDKTNLTSFVSYLVKRLHEANLFVSMDVTGYSDSENWSLVYDRKHLGELLDYVVLMAYDETPAGSKIAGPVASYPWVKENATAITREISPEKLVLGIPYYMRIWEKTISVDANGKVHYGPAKSRTLPMAEAEALKTKYNDRVTWDDELKVNYLRFGNDNLGEMLIAYAETGREPRIAGGLRNKKSTISEVWFEDEMSMQYKLNLIPELKLAGFAAWRKGFETPEFRQYMAKEFTATKTKKIDKPKGKK